MAFRIAQSVIRGEIRNSRRNSISGWIEVSRTQIRNGVPARESAIVTLSIVGNLEGQLCGRDFRFQIRDPDSADQQPALDETFHLQQVGVIGDSVFRMIRVPLVPIEDFLAATQRGDAAPEEQRMSVYLEWFSQNGRIVMELPDPYLEFDGSYSRFADSTTDDSTGSDYAQPPSITTILRRRDGSLEVQDDADESTRTDDASRASHQSQTDPEYPDSLFESTFDDPDQNSSFDDPDDFDDFETSRRPDWDELIPGISPETKALYEQWDELLLGKHDEPLTCLFDEPLRLPAPDNLVDDKHAWEVLSTLLAAMAQRGVAFDMCPHLTPVSAYRLLVEQLLPEVHIHPKLVDSGFICYVSSAEFCDECQQEFLDKH